MTWWHKALEAAKSDLGQRTATNQIKMNKFVAELRERYRLVRLFPIYRYRARAEAGNALQEILSVATDLLGIQLPKADWRMPTAQFETLLGEIVLRMGVPSPDDAMDVCHTNVLHETLTLMARQKAFVSGPEMSGEFVAFLQNALDSGGPIVRDRWLRLPQYTVS